MDIQVTFPGGKRVDAIAGGFTLRTDQPADHGGADSAPAPFTLFLASIATCAGIYALGFCQARGLSTEGLSIVQHVEEDPATHLPSRITLQVTPPVGFPEKYRSALLRSVEGCRVKKTIAAQPVFDVKLVESEAACAVA